MGKLPQPNPKSSSITNNNSISSANNGVTKVKRTRRSVPRDSPPQRSSIYRGVTRHRWTGRYEAHLWDKNCWNESQNKKGRQVYLGAYDDEEAAAHAYDLAALKYWGPETILNFPLSTYEKELKEMDGQSREEYIGSLRRKSSGFSRGVSKYRGVARHHHNGRWEARIGRVFGNKYLYLGTYATQEEAATAYDMAAIEYRGLNAVTNFDLSRYIKWLKPNQSNSSNINNGPDSNITTDHSSATTAPLPKPDQDQDQDLGLTFFHNQQQTYGQPKLQPAPTPMPSPRPSNATSALGLLLQSAKFKEMMEMTAVADHNPSSDPTEHQLLDRGAATPHSFPKDVQTYFECEDLSRYGEGSDDQMFFGELNSFIQPMFQCDFGALLG